MVRCAAVVAVALGLVLSTAACQAADVSRAGGALPVERLRIGAPDPAGRLTANAAHVMASQVDRLTDGGVQLVPVDDAVQDVEHDFDKALIDRVVSGDLDLAVVPTRTWDLVGVTSFEALSTPFLVTSGPLLDRVTTGPIAADMLAGLADSGTTGLTILPGGLRHVFRAEDPVIEPEDYVGLAVRTPHARVPWSTFSALGAEPVDANGTVAAGLADGSIDALETTYAVAQEIAGPTTTAGDVTPFASAYTVVINTDRLGRLSAERRAALQQAADATRAWVVSTAPSDDDEARAFCAAGSSVVIAGPAAVRALQASTAPVVATLRRDPTTRDLMDRIATADVALGSPRPEPAPCGGTPVTAGHVVRPPNTPEAFPTGTYRREVTAGDLEAMGATAVAAGQHAGVWTLTFTPDGAYLDGQCPGSTYTTDGGVLAVTLGRGSVTGCGSAAGQVLFRAGWTLDGSDLTFTGVRSGSGAEDIVSAIFGGGPFRKIG